MSCSMRVIDTAYSIVRIYTLPGLLVHLSRRVDSLKSLMQLPVYEAFLYTKTRVAVRDEQGKCSAEINTSEPMYELLAR